MLIVGASSSRSFEALGADLGAVAGPEAAVKPGAGAAGSCFARRTTRSNRAPTGLETTCSIAERKWSIGRLSIERRRSPARSPAAAAGDLGTTLHTRAPG